MTIRDSRRARASPRWDNGGRRGVPVKTVTAIIAAVVTAVATYFSTISGIEREVVEKADRDSLAAVEHRLVGIETLLQSTYKRIDILESRSLEMQERLIRIESAVQK